MANLTTPFSKRLQSLLHFSLALLTTLVIATPSYATKQCLASKQSLTEQDRQIAKIAWSYFEHNLQPETGLVNAANNFPSTTLWDIGSSLAAFVSAEKLGLIEKDRFDNIVRNMLETLLYMDLFNGEAPNKVYNTKTRQKVNYANKPSETGIGVSALDLGRLSSWLNILACLYPEHKQQAAAVLESWNFCRLTGQGDLYGMSWNQGAQAIDVLQEGRLGYEQYAGKVLSSLGYRLKNPTTYKNQNTDNVTIMDVPILIDRRDGKAGNGGHNYVVSESYAMDAMENGLDAENTPLLENIYLVQQRRWERTGQVTAVSEDNLDRKPYFVYNTIFTNGVEWKALTDAGEDMDALRTISTKAALSMAYLLPEREYSKKLLETVKDAYDPNSGWYSGIYEKTKELNKAITANTNGVILTIMLYKQFGALNQLCKSCGQGLTLDPAYLKRVNGKLSCNSKLPDYIKAAKARAAAHVFPTSTATANPNKPNPKTTSNLTDQKASTTKPAQSTEHKGINIPDSKTKPDQAQTKPIPAKLENAKKDSTLNSKPIAKKSSQQVWDIYGKVKYAISQYEAGKKEEANQLLKAQKKQLWALGDRETTEQKSLQQLMNPIDTLLQQWRDVKTPPSADSKPLLKALKEIAERLQKNNK